MILLKFIYTLYLYLYLILFRHEYASSIKTRILYSSALHFLPILKLHHIVLCSNYYDNKVYAIDFTPINQTYYSTLSKLLLGQDVPAEIRVVYLEDSNFLDKDDDLIKKWERNKEIIYSTYTCDSWNNKMNLYSHNCQHFSKWITSLVK